MNPELSRAQKHFLRDLAAAHGTLPRDAWPSPLVLRRWLRNATFRTALLELREGLRFQTDFHLAGASTRAAAALESQFATTDPDASPDPRHLLLTIRLAHTRQRFEPRPLDDKPFPRPSWFATDADFEAAVARIEAAENAGRAADPERFARLDAESEHNVRLFQQSRERQARKREDRHRGNG